MSKIEINSFLGSGSENGGRKTSTEDSRELYNIVEFYGVG